MAEVYYLIYFEK